MNTLILGDCIEEMKNIPDQSIDLILTDLPYGITACSWDACIPNDELWNAFKRIRKPNTPTLLTATQPFATHLIMSNIKEFKYEFIWEKTKPTGFYNARTQPLKRHELVLVFYSNPPTYNPQMIQGKPYRRVQKNEYVMTDGIYGMSRPKPMLIENNTGLRFPDDIIKINSSQGRRHPSEKPVALMEYLIKTYSNKNDIVLDCCCGSGSTLIAAKNLGREFIGIEKEEKYYNIAKERLI